MSSQTKGITSVTNNGQGSSFFSSRDVVLNGDEERMLSDQIPALNFRLRSSSSSYTSDWHVAGDPTLLVMLAGTIRIHLRNGDFRDFSEGQMFIAEDYLAPDTLFDNVLHGHRAEVVGGHEISVLHLKLNKRN